MKLFKKKNKKEKKPLELSLKFIKLVRYVCEIFLHYVLIVTVCIWAMPMAMVTIGKYIAITNEDTWLNIAIFYLFPCGFVLLIFVWFYIQFTKFLHRRVFDKLYNKIETHYHKDDKKEDIDDSTDDAGVKVHKSHKKKRKKS